MDPIQQEDPDARPKRLVVLAGAGMVVATGFATIAAMALSQQHRDDAMPDVTVAPTSSTRSSHSQSFTLPPTDRLASTTTSGTSEISSDTSEGSESSPEGPPPPPPPPGPSPTGEPTPTGVPTPTRPPDPPTSTKPRPTIPTVPNPPTSTKPQPPTTHTQPPATTTSGSHKPPPSQQRTRAE